MANISYQAIKNIKQSDLDNFTADQAKAILKVARGFYENRKKNIEKADYLSKYGLYSESLDNMEKFYDSNGKPSVSSMTKQRSVKELRKLVNFFNNKTSTVKGAKEVRTAQEKLIFGTKTDSRGRTSPAGHLYKSESKALWDAFNEFKLGSSTSDVFSRIGSYRVQQELGELVVAKRGKDQEVSFESLFQSYLESKNVTETPVQKAARYAKNSLLSFTRNVE